MEEKAEGKIRESSGYNIKDCLLIFLSFLHDDYDDDDGEWRILSLFFFYSFAAVVVVSFVLPFFTSL